MNEQGIPADRRGLPVEPQSGSELLSATHVFTIEILRSDAGEWAGGHGQMQRRLRLICRLLQLFKGNLEVQPPSQFVAEVIQRPVDPYVQMDYMGLWSHADTSAGVRYLIVSRGVSRSPADLMQEGPLKQLFDAALAYDVQAALEAEPLSAQTPAFIKFAIERRGQLDELYGRYFWARIAAPFSHEPSTLASPVLRLIHAPDGRISFRRSLIQGLDDTLSRMDYPVSVLPFCLRVLFSLLLQPEAASLGDMLIQVQIFSAVFRDETVPRISASLVFPDPADRNRYSARLANSDLDRAAALRNWLLGH